MAAAPYFGGGVMQVISDVALTRINEVKFDCFSKILASFFDFNKSQLKQEPRHSYRNEAGK